MPRSSCASSKLRRRPPWRRFASPGELVVVRELVGAARAVEEPDAVVGNLQGMPEHGAERGDAGAAGDEHEPRLQRVGGKGEGAQRAGDVDRDVGLEYEMRARLPVHVDADE